MYFTSVDFNQHLLGFKPWILTCPPVRWYTYWCWHFKGRRRRNKLEKKTGNVGVGGCGHGQTKVSYHSLPGQTASNPQTERLKARLSDTYRNLFNLKWTTLDYVLFASQLKSYLRWQKSHFGNGEGLFLWKSKPNREAVKFLKNEYDHWNKKKCPEYRSVKRHKNEECHVQEVSVVENL